MTQRFPESKQAYLIRDLAEKKGDIGIENAAPQDIIDAIKKAHFTNENAESLFSMEDLYRLGCIGQDDSKATRQKLGQALGIGYGNGKAFLNKLNRLGITRDELDQRWKEIKG